MQLDLDIQGTLYNEEKSGRVLVSHRDYGLGGLLL